MSKSPNIFIPVAGGVALMLGAAYGLASRDYGKTTIEGLEARVAQAEANVASASETAAAEAERAATLELKIAEVQAAAAEQVAAAVTQAAAGVDLTAAAPAVEGGFGLGREAHPEEIAAWDVDVLPDGRGLPEGSGDVFTGEELWTDKCASCHGDFAEGVDNWPVLAGGFDTLADEDPVKTVGSYWPHLSTAWDYIHRSMPFGQAGTLSADETYAIVAYLLYSNDMVDDDFELSHENFTEVEMPNADGFVIDDRPDLEYTAWQAEPCMENCKEEVEVTMRSVFLVETPPEGGSNSIMNEASAESLPSFSAEGAAFIPEADQPPVQAASVAVAEDAPEAGDDMAQLQMSGEKVFKRCQTCHEIGDGATNRTGPHLNGVMGRAFAGADGFGYSKVFQAAAAEGRIWDEAEMAAFLAKPREHMKGTSMSFAGLRKEADIEAIIAYLNSFGG